jgi:hypothetical protein
VSLVFAFDHDTEWAVLVLIPPVPNALPLPIDLPRWAIRPLQGSSLPHVQCCPAGSCWCSRWAGCIAGLVSDQMLSNVGGRDSSPEPLPTPGIGCLWQREGCSNIASNCALHCQMILLAAGHAGQPPFGASPRSGGLAGLLPPCRPLLVTPGPVHPPHPVAHPFPSSTTPGHMYFVQGVTPQGRGSATGRPRSGLCTTTLPGYVVSPRRANLRMRVSWLRPGQLAPALIPLLPGA